ncbi:hypothetical protein FPOAC2_07256 [Fusarium poae]|uniref:hypothetical protein n=1 Tax=Fusarium poae TaxID=36050 RepID=UPI001CE89D8B|nr:hypothetical protein FPOAC1_007103 [Fusarium poae]KAG8673784.1 hypothetical protein FPOAC1_007103 [Fusarium poae]
MASIESVPPEILAEIPLILHDAGEQEEYEIDRLTWRKDLMSLRAVNRMFRDLVNPLLFGRAIIFSGRPVKLPQNPFVRPMPCHTYMFREIGISRLQGLASDPSISKLVRRLEFDGIPHLELLDYLENTGAQLGTFREEDRRFLARISILIHRLLPRFSNLTALKLDLGYTYEKPSRLDGRYNFDSNGTSHWIQDMADLFQAFSLAIIRSGLNKLEELDLSLAVAQDFGHFLNNENEAESSATKEFFQQLKRLRVHVAWHNETRLTLSRTSERPFPETEWNQVHAENVQKLLSLASNVESLKVGSISYLSLGASSLPHSNLRSLQLHRVRVAGEALASLINRCQSLERLDFFEPCIESGTWEDIFTALTRTSIIDIDFMYCLYWDVYSQNRRCIYHPVFVRTDRIEDVKACELMYTQLHENLCRIYGINYAEHRLGRDRPADHAAELRKLLEHGHTDTEISTSLSTTNFDDEYDDDFFF